MSTDPPNILWIMTDQQRFDCLGANGNPLIRTPHLDALARQSANMEACIVQSPVCVPSRQTLFTGRFPHSHRNRVNYTPQDDREVLLQARLNQFGYATGFVGKLHYYPPTREYALRSGFDRGELHDAAQCDKHSDYVAWLRQAAPQYLPDYRSTIPSSDGNPLRTRIPEEFHETTWCGQQTRELLAQLARQHQPFFLFSSYWKPHPPFEVPEPWACLYDSVEAPLPPPEQVSAEHVASLPAPVRALAGRAGQPGTQFDRRLARWKVRSYYAAISQIDDQVGLTLRTLAELGLADTTIVIFCSDHGEQLFEHALIGKNVFFEASIRVPMLLRYPNVVQPGAYDDLVEGTDLLATLFDLCGLPIPSQNQGRSFAERITGGARGGPYTPREYAFSENIIPEVITHGNLDMPYVPGKGVGGIVHPDAKMVRSKRFKYCHYVGHSSELYDLQADPLEIRNLAGDPRYADVADRMKTALLDWMITADETEQIAPRWCDV